MAAHSLTRECEIRRYVYDRLTGDVATSSDNGRCPKGDVLKDFDEGEGDAVQLVAATDEHCELVPFAVW